MARAIFEVLTAVNIVTSLFGTVTGSLYTVALSFLLSYTISFCAVMTNLVGRYQHFRGLCGPFYKK
jgi:hypothetical protein